MSLYLTQEELDKIFDALRDKEMERLRLLNAELKEAIRLANNPENQYKLYGVRRISQEGSSGKQT